MGGRMSNDIKWVIGTGVVLAGLLGGLLSAQIRSLGTSLNTRIDDLNTSLSGRLDRLESRLDARLDGLDERLRNVEIAVGKLDQRLLTIERVVLPGNDQPGN